MNSSMTGTFEPLLEAIQNLASIVLPTAPISTPGTNSIPSPFLPWIDARPPLFAMEPLISASAIFFCRFVIVAGSLTGISHENRSRISLEFFLRTLASLLLGGMAFIGMKYDIICAAHLWSHLFPWAMNRCRGLFQSRVLRGAEKSLGVSSKPSGRNNHTEDDDSPPSLIASMIICTIGLLSFPSCVLICRVFSSPSLFSTIPRGIPSSMKDVILYMLPFTEMMASYSTISAFYTTHEQMKVLHDMLKHLLFVTVHVQFGLGHIGIDFLTSEQTRKNMLIRMDVDNPPPVESDKILKETSTSTRKKKHDPSLKFRRSAPTFILFSVLPYMFQIILFGNMNNFSFMYVRNQIHKSVRIDELFNHDSHLVALASDSATSPDVYASSMDKVLTIAYEIVNRKLFSLPKLILIPGVISRQPSLLVKIFPFIFLADIIKGRLVTTVTDKVELLQKQAQDINSIRQKVEQFDMKHAELMRRSGVGVTQFTQRRWDELTVQYQATMVASDLLGRTRNFFLWLQRNYIFVALIDCALAKLLAEGGIAVAEIFVFSRAIEDVVDLILIRSRSESELATLMTQVEKLKGLDSVWSKSKEPNFLPCRVHNGPIVDGQRKLENDGAGGSIVLNNLQYFRGTAEVTVEHLIIEPGIYAVTGANGSGKSTLFRLLMACETNERPIDLHESIELATPVHSWDFSSRALLPDDSCKADSDCELKDYDLDATAEEEDILVTSLVMPSSDVVEISQVFYWPLYTSPIDWIYQKHVMSDLNETERLACVEKVAVELQSLSFSQSQNTDKIEDGNSEPESNGANTEALERLMGTLQEEREDWFSELSGGQKSKVELVRKVFLRDHCPRVLLVDETMAPLDPASKSQVMTRLKQFCDESIVLVIYHTDVGRGKNATAGNNETVAPENQDCVPSNDFFDHNLHVENKRMFHRHVC